MKTLRWVLAALFAVAMLGCQLPAGRTGSLRVILPSPVRSVDSNQGYGAQVRIQLLRNGATVLLAGNPYLEQGMAGQVVTLEGLSPGAGYSLRVVTGEKEAGDFFEASYFQTSSEFEVTAGVDADVRVVLNRVPYRLLESGSGTHAVANWKGALWYVSGSNLVSSSGATQDLAALGGRTLRSLRAITQPKTPFDSIMSLATDQGVVFWNPASGAFDLRAMRHNVTTKDPNGHDVDTPTDFSPAPEVLLSGSFSALGDDGVTSTVYAYGGNGMTAGLVIVGSDSSTVQSTSDLVWDDLDSMLAIDKNKSIKDSLSGAKDVVTGFATADTYAWLATALATYRIDRVTVSGTTEELGDDFLNNPELQVEAVLDGRTVPVTVVGAAAGRGYGGTNRGLFTAEVDADGVVLNGGDLQLIPATRNLRITALSATKHEGVVYAAAYSEATKEVLILNGATVIATIPAFAGLPAGTPQFAWWVDGSTLTLAVAGTNGTVAYPVR